jgi:hypothetical protein
MQGKRRLPATGEIVRPGVQDPDAIKDLDCLR